MVSGTCVHDSDRVLPQNLCKDVYAALFPHIVHFFILRYFSPEINAFMMYCSPCARVRPRLAGYESRD
jgi:hypothetical protein